MGVDIPGGSVVKNGSVGQEDPLENEMATQVFLPGRLHGQRSLTGYGP